MAGVWGRGGLFEQAVQQKYANQGRELDLKDRGIGVDAMKAQNDLRLGLRDADINQINAQTNRFNADTARGELAGKLENSFRGSDIREFGLGSSFRAGADDSSSAVGSISRASMGASSNTDASGGYAPYRAPESTRSLLSPSTYYRGANNTFGSSPEAVNEIGGGVSSMQGTFSGSTPGPRLGQQTRPAMRPLGFSMDADGKTTYTNGFRNSGKVTLRMKPQMVKQPGYKNSGKVMGYADSGKVIPDEHVEIRKKISELAAQGDIDGATDLQMKLNEMETTQVKPGFADSGKVWPGVDPAAPLVKTPREIMDEQFRRNVEASRTGGDMQQFLKAPKVPVKLFANSGSAEGGLRSPKSFGPIGDVEDDTGRDTIDAKVRPGEYLLNPETVEDGFGDGDYDKGVRKLDNIVRRATGKEPGPTMMNDAKPGFNLGGFVDDYGNLPSPDKMTASQRQFLSTPEGQRAMAGNLRQVQAEATAAAARTPPSSGPAGVPRRTYAQMAAEDQAKRSAYRNSVANSTRGAGAGVERARGLGAAANRVLDMSVSEATKKAGQGAVRAGKAIGRGAGAVLKRGTTGLGRVATPVAMMVSASQTYDTPTEEYYARTGIDPNAEDGNYLDNILPPESSGNPYANAIRNTVGFLGDKQFVKDIGVRSLGAMHDLGNTLTFGIFDGLGNAQNAPAAAAAPAAEPVESLRDAGSNLNVDQRSIWDNYAGDPGADGASSEQQPSLRDFLVNQYRALAEDNRAVGSLTRVEQMKNIGDMINNMDQTSATARNAQLEYDSKMDKAARDNRKDVVDAIASQFATKNVNPETGEVKYVNDPITAAKFERAYPEALARAERYGIDSVMPLIDEFNGRNRATQRVNAQDDGGGGIYSDAPIRLDEIGDVSDITLADTLLPTWLGGDSNYTGGLRDWWRGVDFGMYDNDKDKRVMVRGKSRPLSQLLRDGSGAVDADAARYFENLQPYLVTK